MLQFRGWVADPQVPEPHFDHTHCLVYQGFGRLFLADPFRPARYRHSIAEATGASASSMRLYAGHPRPEDVSINGVPCSTVIAVGSCATSKAQPVWHMALLDCRLLGMGWSAVTVIGRFVIKAPEITCWACLCEGLGFRVRVYIGCRVFCLRV